MEMMVPISFETLFMLFSHVSWYGWVYLGSQKNALTSPGVVLFFKYWRERFPRNEARWSRWLIANPSIPGLNLNWSWTFVVIRCYRLITWAALLILIMKLKQDSKNQAWKGEQDAYIGPEIAKTIVKLCEGNILHSPVKSLKLKPYLNCMDITRGWDPTRRIMGADIKDENGLFEAYCFTVIRRRRNFPQKVFDLFGVYI